MYVRRHTNRRNCDGDGARYKLTSGTHTKIAARLVRLSDFRISSRFCFSILRCVFENESVRECVFGWRLSFKVCPPAHILGRLLRTTVSDVFFLLRLHLLRIR